MLFLSILYPYSCKTHKISSKLGFCRILDGKQVIWQDMGSIFQNESQTSVSQRIIGQMNFSIPSGI